MTTPRRMSGAIMGPFFAMSSQRSHVSFAQFMKYVREHVAQIGPS